MRLLLAELYPSPTWESKRIFDFRKILKIALAIRQSGLYLAVCSFLYIPSCSLQLTLNRARRYPLVADRRYVYRRWTIVQLNSQNSHVHQLLLRLGKRIRSLRKQRGWSQEEFAHRSGLNRSYMSDIEGGKSDISLSRLRKVAHGLGITIAELFSDVG